MLRFQSLGDGNCLYNTEAVWLMYAYQQQLLQPLFKNKDAKFNQLMAIVGQQNPSLGLAKTQAEFNTPETLINAFDTLIACVAINDDIDWVKLQKILAPALRAFVVDLIKNDKEINSKAKSELANYLDNMVDSCHVAKVDNLRQTQICALQVEVLAKLNDFVGKNPSVLPKKLPDIKKYVENELLDFIGVQINAANQSVAIKELVIGNMREIVASLASNSKKRALNTLREDVQSLLKQRLEAIVEKGMPDDDIILAAHFEDMQEIQEQIKTILKTDKTPAIHKHEIKAWFFGKDAPGLTCYLANIAQDGINAGEFEQKVLSSALGHVMKVRCLEFLDEHNTRIVNGFKKPEQAKKIPKSALVFEMEKLPGHWNALLADTEANQQLIALYDKQRHNYIEKKTKPEPKQLKAQNTSKSTSQTVERDWVNYATMFLALTAILGIITHGLVWPLLTIFVPTLVRNLAINNSLSAVQFTSSALFGGLFGFLITEKVHLEAEQINVKPTPANPTQTAGAPILSWYRHLFTEKPANDATDKIPHPEPKPKAKAATVS